MATGLRRTIGLGVLMLVGCTGANAMELPQDWNLARNYANVKRMGGAPTVGMYLMGAGGAYLVANANAQMVNRPPLYCQPASLTLNGLNYLDIFEKELARSRSDDALNYGDEMILLFGLRRMFPCTAK
jgi:hypothetical protein